MDGGNGDHAPPLLSRLVSGLSSLLGAAYPDQEGDNDSSSRKPVPAVPIDTKWLGAGEEGGQLPQELLVCILSSLSLPSLAAFAATSRAYWRLLTAEGAAAAMDARSLYRCVRGSILVAHGLVLRNDTHSNNNTSIHSALLLREVGDELPLDEFGPEELDWRACLRRWTRGECQWRRLPLEGVYTGACIDITRD